MATQKPISTISYNTEAFLREKLEELRKAHTIQAYQYIKHKGEDGDKDHIHLRIEPNRALDPMDLTELLREYQFGKDKPLGVRPWRPSKEEDWFLYAVHDSAYMKLKYGELTDESHEKLPYDFTEIVVSDGYDLDVAWIRAKASLKRSASGVLSRLRDGASALDLVAEGSNPFVASSLLRLANDTQYTDIVNRCHRLETENASLLAEMEKLLYAIDKFGLVVESDGDGTPFLVAPNKDEKFKTIPNWKELKFE